MSDHAIRHVGGDVGGAEPATDEPSSPGHDEHEIPWDAVLRLRSVLEHSIDETHRLDQLDDAVVNRLADAYGEVRSEIHEMLPPHLAEELETLATGLSPSSTAGEVRLAQRQLSAWIAGLLDGVKLSMAIERAQGTDPTRRSDGSTTPTTPPTSSELTERFGTYL